MIALAAQALSFKLLTASVSVDVLSECSLFMRHTRDLGWSNVTDAIVRRTGIEISLDD
jgi:hypothetical protein